MTAPLTILITTYSRRDILERTLWYIFQTSAAEDREIIIWDNASTDDTPDFLGTLIRWPGVRVFRSRINRGVIYPKQQMLRVVNTPFIFTMDDDIWISGQGWAAAISKVLAADASIGQLGIEHQVYSPFDDFGVGHTSLPVPFFHMPDILPHPRFSTAGTKLYEGMILADIGGESVIVPGSGAVMPRPHCVSGTAAGWRTDDVRELTARPEWDAEADLRQTWGADLRAVRKRDALLCGYTVSHPSPGPLWYVGRYENYWRARSERAREWYNRDPSGDLKWLSDARESYGWGRELDDPDKVIV